MIRKNTGVLHMGINNNVLKFPCVQDTMCNRLHNLSYSPNVEKVKLSNISDVGVNLKVRKFYFMFNVCSILFVATPP